MPTKQFDDVSCKYGAPMGRREYCDDDAARVHVFRVRMVDGDYDDGGAYWGGYPSKPLYCVRDDNGLVQLFIRGHTRYEVLQYLAEHHPDLRPMRGPHRKSTTSN